MASVADSWSRPRSSSVEVAQWYYVGRGALAHADWHAAQAALARAVEQLGDSGEWPLLWLCQFGLATLAWRSEDGPAALAHTQEAHALADRLEGPWARIWSLWLLGHLYAGHHRRTEAAACFTAVQDQLGGDDEHQEAMGHLVAVASMQCAVESCQAETLAERLFGLALLAARVAKRQGLPVEAIESLEFAPSLVARSQPEATGGHRALSWLRNILPRHEAPAPRQETDALEHEQAVGKHPGADPEGAPDLRAYCLGRFEVWVGHTLITQWSGGKGKALLKLLLAAYPAPMPAANLMGSLWDGVEEELARQRLHTVISDLRRSLRTARPDAGNLVVSQSGGYGLDPRATIWIDVVEFTHMQRAALQYEQSGRRDDAQAALREAVALYRGEFLEEDRYEDWPVEQRERLKSEYLTILARLAQWAFAEGDYDVCLGWGQMIVECDSCREDAHRLIMYCYSRLGQRAMALRQYRLCADALRRELDAIPEAETDDLYRHLQQGQEL